MTLIYGIRKGFFMLTLVVSNIVFGVLFVSFSYSGAYHKWFGFLFVFCGTSSFYVLLSKNYSTRRNLSPYYDDRRKFSLWKRWRHKQNNENNENEKAE